jgi:predicted esterase
MRDPVLAADPHAGQPVLHAGARPEEARLALIMVHGRGASASDMIGLAEEVFFEDISYFAPEAAGQTWYPYSFMAPIAQNEPGITSGLKVVDDLIASLVSQGLGADRIVLFGFSQGACLSLEFAARHARRYAAVIGLSGGLIGPEGTSREYQGSLGRTPVFLGCSDRDPHIPLARVHETAEVFRGLGASVDERIYPRMGHTVNRDEIEAVRQLLKAER